MVWDHEVAGSNPVTPTISLAEEPTNNIMFRTYVLRSHKTRREAVTKERYYETGPGRDELDRLEVERSPQRLTPTKSTNTGMTLTRLIIFAAIGGLALTSYAQEAAQPIVDLTSKRNEQNPPATTPSTLPDIPELSQLDEIFKQTSLGKTADNFRLHVEWRQLRNQVVNNPDVVAAKKAAESARTDLEKRERLRQYYNIYYAHMQALAKDPQVKSGLEAMKTAHLSLFDQPHVRPSLSPSPLPLPVAASTPNATASPTDAEESEH